MRGAEFPVVTAAQMAAVDRAMYEQCGLDVLQVMETAGRSVASFARDRYLNGDPRGKHVLVLCGSGGNGGDGMVAARYLHTWGALAEVWLGRIPESGHGVAAHQLAVLQRLGLPIHQPDEPLFLPAADLVIDALIGFGLEAAPAGQTAALIRAANEHPVPLLSIDLPSGLDATSGHAYDPCIQAQTTLTLALPKTGLLAGQGPAKSGQVFVADIGVPPLAYETAGIARTDLLASAEFVPLVKAG